MSREHERERRVQKLFDEVRDLSPEARAERLAPEPPDVREDVERLIAHHERAAQEGWLKPAATSTAAWTGEEPYEVGDRIDRYVIRGEIGKGGMGRVFLASQDKPIRREVALKVIRDRPDAESRETTIRFEAERQALATMDHPNIARVFDAGETARGRPYFVMQYVRGDPITDYADRQRLDTPARLRLFLQACHAVQHAHTKSIIHRDIKPDNLLVTVPEPNQRPLVKLVDFGLARSLSQPLTESPLPLEKSQQLGTPEYMSPEQAEMTGLDVDTRTDVYALGVVLYELLIGALPFELRGKQAREIARIIREQEPLSPSTRITELGEQSARIARARRTDVRGLRRHLGGDLDWITMRAMAKDRTERYQSAAEIAADVMKHLDGDPVSVAPAGRLYRLGKTIRRHRGLVATTALVVLGLLVGVIGLALGRAEAERQRLRAEAARQTAEGISAFLTGELLPAASPEHEPDASITVREIVTRTTSRMARAGSDRQDLPAAIHLALGDVANAVAAFDDAITQFEQAAKRLGSDPEPADARALDLGLGYAWFWKGRQTGSQPLVRNALERFERWPDVSETRLNKAACYNALGDPTRAEELYQELLDEAPEAGIEVAIRTNLASMFQSGGLAAEDIDEDAAEYYEKARTELKRALVLALDWYGPAHFRTGVVLNNVANTEKLLGNIDVAIERFREAYEVLVAQLGVEAASTQTAIRNLCELANERCDEKKAPDDSP